MKKKIGIITYHNVLNYGAYLQVYSLQNFLKKKDYEVEIINYKSLRFIINEFRSLFSKNLIKSFCQFINYLKFFFYRKKINKSNFFIRKNKIPYSKYDLIIFGSDEIWNYKNPLIGYDDFYFGNNCKTKKISYAVSFGTIENIEKDKNEIISNLNNFQSITVRDINSKNIIENEIKRKTEIVLDPVLIYDFKDEINKETEYKNLKNQIVVYGHHFKNEEVKKICKYAKLNSKKLVSLGYYHKWCDSNYPFIKPFELLKIFINSSCVFTNMFHGAIFSIKFDVSFYLLFDEYRNNKLDYLTQLFNLKKVSIKDEFNIQNLNNTKIKNIILKEKISRSKQFLIDQINEIL
jgi:hypothetical protein